jgi:transcriptional regulator with XRE-family HTH domain
MKITNQLSDETILSEIGKRITRRRLDLQLTQAEVAEQAGVAKRTVERIEAGGSSQMSNMIRVFRVLDLLSDLDHFLPKFEPRPLELLKRKNKIRQRASKSRRHRGTGTKDENEPWTWGEDQ